MKYELRTDMHIGERWYRVYVNDTFLYGSTSRDIAKARYDQLIKEFKEQQRKPLGELLESVIL
jgi:hypothetical protein